VLASSPARSGPPCMATLGAIITRSTNAAPVLACGQSTTTTPSPVSSRLSARRSPCSRVRPAECSGQVASSSARPARCRADHVSSPSAPPAAARSRQPRSIRLSRRPTAVSSTGVGVSAAASRSVAASTWDSWPGCQGSSGCTPSTSSSSSAIHGGWSITARRRGAGTRPSSISGASAASTRLSLRCIFGESGLASADTALTKNRRPSAQLSRAAAPGLKPPGWVTARATGDPHACSTAARTGAGSPAQSTLTPSAAGPVIWPACPLTPRAGQRFRRASRPGPGRRRSGRRRCAASRPLPRPCCSSCRRTSPGGPRP